MDANKLQKGIELEKQIVEAKQKLFVLQKENFQGWVRCVAPNGDYVTPGVDLQEVLYSMIVDYWTVRLADLEFEFQNL